jgi:hypothetical protein
MTQGDLQQTDGLIVNIINDKLGLAQPLTENDINRLNVYYLFFLQTFVKLLDEIINILDTSDECLPGIVCASNQIIKYIFILTRYYYQ